MSDTNIGWGAVPHRKSCRCDECECERLRAENAELLRKLRTLEVERSIDQKLFDAEQERIKELVRRLGTITQLVNKVATDRAYDGDLVDEIRDIIDGNMSLELQKYLAVERREP